MKHPQCIKLVLASAIFSLAATTARAQVGAGEIGFGAGLAVNGNPSTNMVYKGNSLALNYAGVVNGVYNLYQHMTVGLEVRATALARKAPNSYTTYMQTVIGGDGERFVYSKMALSACLLANGKYTLARGYVYGGGAIGYGMSRHNSARLNANEDYRAPDGGRGVVYGAQAGYTHGLTKAVAVNIEGTLRRYNMAYNAGAPEIRPYTDLNYNITSYALTVALRFRLAPRYSAQNDIPSMRGGGQSMRPLKPRRK